MNDIEKQMAIHCSTQREKDQYIIDNAEYFRCVYKTYRSNEPSGKFKNVDDARTAAVFAAPLLPLSGRKNPAPIKIMAYIEDSKGNVFEALIEEIKVGYPTSNRAESNSHGKQEKRSRAVQN